MIWAFSLANSRPHSKFNTLKKEKGKKEIYQIEKILNR